MLGKRILDARLKSKYSQKDLASKLNTDKNTIGRYENDKSMVPFVILIQLSKIFKKPLGYFFQDVIVNK